MLEHMGRLPETYPFPEQEPIEHWQDNAACREVIDKSIFFPSRGGQQALQAAKEICKDCIVKEECLDFAIENKIHFGVYGGASERQRRRISRTRKRDGL